MLQNPHDALVKAVFGESEHARGVLRAVVPGELAKAIDWSLLTREPGSFVDTALREQHTDLLFSVPWRDGSKEALVYLLFEHQSSAPTGNSMAYRLLRYQVRIWESWRAEHPNAKPLPMIVPIVLYHGAVPWPEPRSFSALFGVPDDLRPALSPHLLDFTYLIEDLSVLSDQELHDRSMMTALGKLTEMCLKHGRTDADLIEILRRWIKVIGEVVRAPHGLEALARVMRYLLEVNERVTPESLQALLERELGPEAKETVMTAGQQLIEQGIPKGERRLLMRQLRQRFGDAVNADVERRLADASVEQLECWGSRVLTAATLADVLAD